MSQEKSQEPSAKKLQDARKKGQVAVSQLPHQVWGLFLIGLLLPLIGKRLWLNSGSLLECGFAAGVERLSQCNAVLHGMTQELIMLPVLALVGTQLLVGLFQTGWNLSFHSLKLDFSKLNPVKGCEKIVKAIKWFPFDLLKFGYTSCVVFVFLLFALFQLAGWFVLTEVGATQLAGQVVRLQVIGFALALLPVLVADVLVQRYKHRSELRMTHQEVREEHKSSEGDPHIKARRRSLHQSLSREAMTKRIKQAKVVLVAREGR